MARVPETPLNPDEPNSIAELADNTRREVDGNLEFGSPQDPLDVGATTLPGTATGHNGTLQNISGSWASADVTALNTAVTFRHNLFQEPEYPAVLSGNVNVRVLAFFWQHNGTAGTTNAEWVRIFDHTVTSTAVTTVATGSILDGNAHKIYRINYRWHGVLNAINFLLVQYNGDGTAANYTRQVLVANGTTLSGGRSSTLLGAEIGFKAAIAAATQMDGECWVNADVTATPASWRRGYGAFSYGAAGLGLTSTSFSTHWVNTTSNITSITFANNNGTADIGINSHFEIWAARAEGLQNNATVGYNFHTGDTVGKNTIDLRFYAGGNRLVDVTNVYWAAFDGLEN